MTKFTKTKRQSKVKIYSKKIIKFKKKNKQCFYNQIGHAHNQHYTLKKKKKKQTKTFKKTGKKTKIKYRRKKTIFISTKSIIIHCSYIKKIVLTLSLYVHIA